MWFMHFVLCFCVIYVLFIYLSCLCSFVHVIYVFCIYILCYCVHVIYVLCMYVTCLCVTLYVCDMCMFYCVHVIYVLCMYVTCVCITVYMWFMYSVCMWYVYALLCTCDLCTLYVCDMCDVMPIQQVWPMLLVVCKPCGWLPVSHVVGCLWAMWRVACEPCFWCYLLIHVSCSSRARWSIWSEIPEELLLARETLTNKPPKQASSNINISWLALHSSDMIWTSHMVYMQGDWPGEYQITWRSSMLGSGQTMLVFRKKENYCWE